ncbi:MAG: hypothetical protein ACP5FT_01560 [Acidilobus sp.]
MPRVDEGAYVVEFAEVMSLSDNEIEGLAQWALSSRALFVTSPSILTVRTSAGPVRIALGIGSLISTERPPTRYYVVTAPEWVDACSVGEVEPVFFTTSPGPQVALEGVAVALDVTVPVALMLNSLRLSGEFSLEPQGQPVLVIEGGSRRAVALSVTRDGFVMGASSGRAATLLRYGLTLFTSCRRRPA